MAIAHFWFSTEHLCIVKAPFWLSTDDIQLQRNAPKFRKYITALQYVINSDYSLAPKSIRQLFHATLPPQLRHTPTMGVSGYNLIEGEGPSSRIGVSGRRMHPRVITHICIDGGAPDECPIYVPGLHRFARQPSPSVEMHHMTRSPVPIHIQCSLYREGGKLILALFTPRKNHVGLPTDKEEPFPFSAGR